MSVAVDQVPPCEGVQEVGTVAPESTGEAPWAARIVTDLSTNSSPSR